MSDHATIFAAALLCLLTFPVAGRAQTETGFADIAPILAQKCVMCHSGPAAPLALRLDSLEALLQGSTNGPVLVSGNPDESELVRRLKGISLPRMPMTGPPFLTDEEVTIFERWIAGGLQAGAKPSTPATVRASPPPGEHVTWLEVAPVFATRCTKCHTENGLMGSAPEGFLLTSYESTLASSDRARVVPGQPEASELLRRVRGEALPRMPFDGPPFLSAEEIQLIENWIGEGARNAEGSPAPIPAGARVRLHGTLDPGGRLDGLQLIIGPDARIDKNPAPGDYVQVRGRLNAAGQVVVERLRPR